MKLLFDSPLSITFRNSKDGKTSVSVDVLGGSFYLPRESCPVDLKEGQYSQAQFEVVLRSVKTDFGSRSVFSVVRLVSLK